MRALTVLMLALISASTLACPPHRSLTQKRHFAKTHPCPATGLAQVSCPGYVIDHVVPLCAHGLDRPSNMQWQTLADAKAKDVFERAECAHKTP